VKRLSPDVLSFEDGELCYQQGDIGNVLYVIRSGGVQITREDSHGEILLATLGPGEFFGEMSLLSGGRRSSTVRAEGGCELEVVTRSVFLEHIKDPLARRVLSGVSDRLRKVDSLLEYLHIEQCRVRQDAHDRVYNRLAALSRLIEIAGLKQNAEIGVHDEEGNTIGLVEIAADIRQTVTELQQILGDRAGLDQSPTVEHEVVLDRLKGVCDSQGDIWAMDVFLHCESTLPTLSQPLCWDLECIVEEALTNAAKHGEASRVRVMIDLHENGDPLHLALSVVDDGNGMEIVPELHQLPEHSKGLRGMHSRVQRYGGWLDLASGPGETVLSVMVPIAAD